MHNKFIVAGLNTRLKEGLNPPFSMTGGPWRSLCLARPGIAGLSCYSGPSVRPAGTLVSSLVTVKLTSAQYLLGFTLFTARLSVTSCSAAAAIRRRQILGTFAMSEPQGLVALPLDPGSYLANTSSLTLALV